MGVVCGRRKPKALRCINVRSTSTTGRIYFIRTSGEQQVRDCGALHVHKELAEEKL